MTVLNNTILPAESHQPDAALIELGRRWDRMRRFAHRAKGAAEDRAIATVYEIGARIMAHRAATLAGAAVRARVALHAASVAFGDDMRPDNFESAERELARFL